MKRKILYTIPNFKTAGSGKVVYDLVMGLKDDFQIEIACFEKGGELSDEIEGVGIKVHEFAFAIKGKPYYNLLQRTKPIRRFLKTNEIDLVHSWHYLDDWTEALSSRLAGTPYLFTKKSMSWGGKDWWLRSKLANKVITINHDMNAEFYPGWKNVDYIPLGLDTNQYQPQEIDPQTYVETGLSDQNFIMLSVANLVPVKGIETAISALKELNNPNVKYLIVGGYLQSYYDELLELVDQLYLTDQVIFLGKKHDVKPYLSIADVFVIPTLNEGRKEGLPIAPLEAMSSGKVVAGSRIPGTKDILQNHQNLLFESRDVKGLAKVIEGVMHLNTGEKNELEQVMRNEVVSRFNLNGFIDSHKQLYHSLIG